MFIEPLNYMRVSKAIVLFCAVFMIILGMYSYLALNDFLSSFVWIVLGVFFGFLGFIRL